MFLRSFLTHRALIAGCLFLLPAGAIEKQPAGSGRAKPPVANGIAPTDFFDRPIPMGVSISNTPSLPFIYAGTAGLRVRGILNPGIKYILSNNHVLGAQGPSICPDTANSNTFALQPGTLDIGFDPGIDPTFAVGRFARKVQFVAGPTANNLVDAAVAFTNTSKTRTAILGIGEPTPSYTPPTVGMPVVKSGRTTGVTVGTVSTVNLTVGVTYGTDCGSFRFVRQVEITPGAFSAGGDSGSAILSSATHQPVGLLFAGSSASIIANDILYVYLTLGVFVESDATSLVSEQEIQQMLTQDDKDPEQARLESIQAQHQERILSLPEVQGIGISKDAGRWFFKVFVRQSSPEALRAIPQSIEDIPVRVVESGEFRAL
jgi:hypothetical protein